MDLKQVFEYAIDQEIQAREFYERSAAQTDNAEASALFRSLARMEGAHRRVLETEFRLLTETGEIKQEREARQSAADREVESLRHVTRVLREANVELRSQHKKLAVELETAAQIQEALLPRTVPQLTNVEISVSCSMAEQVGGDYYDFALMPGGRLALTIADVSGKGLPAAMLMMSLRTLWRSRAQADELPERILDGIAADEAMDFEQHDQYVTIISALYDPAIHRLTFANAGHWPPLTFLGTSETSLPISPGFLPIGLNGDTHYEAHAIDLIPGSIVVFFSDGILDAVSPGGTFFGEERFRELVRNSRHLSAAEIRDTVTTSIFEFSQGRQKDDQTLMVIKRKP